MSRSKLIHQPIQHLGHLGVQVWWRPIQPVYTVLSQAGKTIVVAKPGSTSKFASHCREVASSLMNPNSANHLDRRRFLLTALRGAGGAWASVHWPAVLEAAQHAAHARDAVPPAKLEVLSAEEAAEIEAAACRIIPSDDSPGAREAGVIYFIDRALATFAADQRDGYVQGLPVLQAKTREMFSSIPKFSQASPDQQDAVLKALEGQPIFELIYEHTVMGFLSVPERGGNRGKVGWKQIGFDDSPAFAPPFGYYDRGYRT